MSECEAVFTKKHQPVNKTAITLGDVSEHESFINSACPVGLE